jgi:hypothetical protein
MQTLFGSLAFSEGSRREAKRLVRNERHARVRPSVGLFQMLRDVLIASISKGQFPVASVVLILMVAMLRMPPEDVSELMFRLLEAAERSWVSGYLLAAALLVGWIYHARHQRRRMTQDMERISAELSALQAQVLATSVRSSEGVR